ncbi:hypothetical protein D5086_002081 [Populus alba]|uniref:Uncharacterized protein n=2 Tax=Populus TaxID=3689 RepID=A0ACC4D2T2_POPAL|nr:hypothetical protein NC653_002506 [Populus alba x Populus x berolinensis]
MYRSIALVACNSGVCILHTQCRLYCGGKRALLASLSMTVLPLPPAAEKFKLTDQKVQFPSCNLVEAQSNEEEVELRSKIEALGLEVAKLPSKSTNNLDELEIARELDKLSAKLDDVDEMISSALASDPQVQSLLSDTADVWMPVITANADERRNFTASVGNDKSEEKAETPK